MNLESFRNYCLTKKGAEETYPFGQQAVWFKVGGKAFAWTFVEAFKMEGEMKPPFTFVNLKCEPEQAILWREKNEGVKAGWHQNKKYWNSIFMGLDLSDTFIQEMIDHSYQVVVASLPKKTRTTLKL